ncbi:hypothetical protein ORI89_15990 [Sphingobacterium sp. UT-1RO-CII-1]|uniref:hypothetical protein n=1 Tax=Sphingobacterium sp. UT-1RO-CII-1 TaxID=2995225 RepID=UPI00227B0722|nr:hypothetical protein [Sphingobacterium sp. UT-1RO-CII-1]MCY4781163.1 hypothetical protein [Sphingobacterium sp. UT-1RO-CII-1]
MDKVILVQIVLSIHFILMGIMLFRLFKLKSATGGQVILALIIAIIPVIGPSGLIVYFNRLLKEEAKTAKAAPQRNKKRK